MNRAERIYRLHALLQQRRPVSLNKLLHELNASRATVIRDIGYMRDFMDAPIVYDREANGYHYDPDAPAFELPGLWFNASELYALLTTEQLLESMQPGLLTPYIGPLKGRIRRLLDQSGHGAAAVAERIRIQPVAARSTNAQQFGIVAGAVLNGRRLRILYHGRERGAATERVVHPYRLVHYRDNWYLAAHCENAKALRTFSLDRILEAEESEISVAHREGALLDRHLSASFGIFTGEATHWAVLRFTAERARWVADEQWHPDQIGQWLGESYELQIPYSDPRELLMDILKYGPDVEVIAPSALRALVAERLGCAAARYSAASPARECESGES